MIESCMGGWCRIRSRCPNHAAASPDAEPAERLCERGADGVAAELPVIVHRPVGTWERGASGLLAPASPFPGAA